MKPLPASVRVPREVVYQQIGEEAVLLNLKTGVYWGLNPTGATIWREISRHGNVSKTLAVLKQSFDASEKQLSAALRGLLNQLSKEGLIELNVSG